MEESDIETQFSETVSEDITPLSGNTKLTGSSLHSPNDANTSGTDDQLGINVDDRCLMEKRKDSNDKSNCDLSGASMKLDSSSLSCIKGDDSEADFSLSDEDKAKDELLFSKIPFETRSNSKDRMRIEVKKCRTDTDDTEPLIPSQDIFSESEGFKSSSSQNEGFKSSSSQTSSAGSKWSEEYSLSSQTTLSNVGGTSTPYKSATLKDTWNTSKERQVIPISDDDSPFDVKDKRDKRKIAERNSSSSDSKENAPKRFCAENFDSRLSIMIVDEKPSSQKLLSGDFSANASESQIFRLHLSQSLSDKGEFKESSVSQSSLLSRPSSMKGFSSNECKESSVSDTPPKEKTLDSTDRKVDTVRTDDDDDDIQVISPVPKEKPSKVELNSSSSQVTANKDPLDNSFISAIPARLRPDVFNKSLISKQNKHSTPHPGLVNSPDHQEISAISNISKENSPHVSLRSDKVFKKFAFGFDLTRWYDPTAMELKKVDVTSFDVDVCVCNSREEKKKTKVRLGYDSSSPGAQGDVSSVGSLGSVRSGPGPFPLPAPHNRLSTASSGSAESSASAMLISHRAKSVVSSNYRSLTSSTSIPVQGSFELLEQELRNSDLIPQLAAAILESCTAIESDMQPVPKKNETRNNMDSADTKDTSDEIISAAPTKRNRSKAAASRRRYDTTPRSTRKKRTKGTKAKSVADNASVKETPNEKSEALQPESVVDASRALSTRSASKRTVSTPSNASPSIKEKIALPIEQIFASDMSYSSHFQKGVEVFALWTDKTTRNYYPAVIESRMRSNYWKVVFHDNQKKELQEKFILPINTFECGQQIFAKNADLDYELGEVVGVRTVENGVDIYSVKLKASETEVQVKRSDVFLTEDQARACLLDKTPLIAEELNSPKTRPHLQRGYAIDLDNVVHGKRTRTPKTDSKSSSSSSCVSPKPGPSHRKLITDSSSAAEDDPLAVELVYGVQPEQIGWATADPLARKGSKGAKSALAKQSLPDLEDQNELRQLGPIPPKGSTIFANKNFLLTCTDARPLPKRKPDLDSSRVSTTDNEGTDAHPNSESEAFEFSRVTICKSRLERQLEAGGGKVYKKVEDVPRTELNKTFLITNRPCLTATYIRCLVLGIHAVQHDIVIQCCKENMKFDNVQSWRLPVGYSIEKRGFIASDDCVTLNIFNGAKIHVHSCDKNFVSFWKDIITLAGGQCVGIRSGDLSGIEIILAESPTDKFVAKAQLQNIPLVSPRWITQCLINNKMMSCHGHPSYKFDYVDSD